MVEITALIVATPVVSLVFGILVLIFPKILNYLVGLYLVIIGLIGILGLGFF